MTTLKPFPPSHCIADDRAGVQLLGLKICCRKNLRSCSFLISSSAADGASGQWQWRWPEEVELPPDIILNPAHQTHQPLLPYFRVEKLMHSKITQHRKGFLVLYVLHDRARASCMLPEDVLKVFLWWEGEYDFKHCQQKWCRCILLSTHTACSRSVAILSVWSEWRRCLAAPSI